MKPKSEITQQERKRLIGKLLLRFSSLIILFILMIFLPAGTFCYTEAYFLLISFLIPMLLVLIYFLKFDPRFLERRMRMKEKEKEQKVIISVMTPVFLSCFIISGLDKRFGWSEVPFVLAIISDLLVLSGYIFVFFVFKENSYASRVIEVEAEQKVISTGPYSVIRHPMYLGVLFMYSFIPVALGSYWGLLASAFLPISLVLRILNEEEVLKRNLPGYNEYCIKTRYRLIPYIW